MASINAFGFSLPSSQPRSRYTCLRLCPTIVTTLGSLATLAQVLGTAPPVSDAVVQRLHTDSRTIEPGDLFVALAGDRFDGCDFVAEALARGAIGAIVPPQRRGEFAVAGPFLAAEPLAAYQTLARWWRERCPLPVVAVTGSAGKTTTKELLASILTFFVPAGQTVAKNLANHNNDIGVAQTLLTLHPERHGFAVVEMGMRGPGEIDRLARMARPDVAAITNIGTAHIGRLGSQGAIAAAKCELLAALPPDKMAVLNGDDPWLTQTAARCWSGPTLHCGFEGGEVRGVHRGDRLTVTAAHRQWTGTLPLPGAHNARNLLLVFGVLQALDLPWETLPADLPLPDLPAGRARWYPLGGVTILDETYNASPEAVMAAIGWLATVPARKRWAVLGTMKELGDRSTDLHRAVGDCLKAQAIDGVVVLCDGEADVWLDCGVPAWGVTTHAAAADQLLTLVQPGDAVLFKASRSVGLEQALQQFGDRWAPP
ncbi:MAG: UDP-N-acetylmuramoyl-tripeptide--D-alanyl-D-alanine ligase [Oscillatoriales cyanobacterium SM2_1_8]|nr:UDP-N-acetylmuramoyl-tripeptide--D-alanyl-D-alanine ligase [Oscillatoriales cyanobacterium SM2_1_8]